MPRLSRYLELGAIAGVVQQFRPPQISDFGGGGIDSPIYIDSRTGESFIFVNGVITPFVSVLNLKSFGARGDGTTDDFTAITAAIAKAQATRARLYAPAGIYATSQPIVISGTPVFIEGDGSASGAFGPIPGSRGTTIKYIGSNAAATVLTFRGLQAGAGLDGIALNGNGVAANGLVVDTTLWGRFSGVSIDGATTRGAIVRATSAVGSTCSFNTFRDFAINMAGGVTGLEVTGDTAVNACHNSFYDFWINYPLGTTTGMVLGCCDNNRFYNFFIFRPVGVGGVGVLGDPSILAGFPVNNIFFHLQSMGGFDLPTVGNACGIHTVWGYMQDNGEPDPTAAAKRLLTWHNGYNLFLPSYASLNGGAAVVYGKAQTALGVNADLDTTNPGSGIYMVRNLATGGVALLVVDMGLGTVRVVDDGSAIVAVGADPGAGANKFWVSAISATTLRLRNRYAATKDVSINCLTAFGTPS